MIELTNTTKLYKTVIGVNDITLNLEPGTYGLLGPNGSGKTTLINLILGQLRPTIGSVRLFGENPWRRSGLLRRVGLCPAVEVTYPRVSGLEWVTYMIQLHGFGFDDASRMAKAALETVKLTYAMDRPMRNYSLGMRQRAKIAQAIAHEPELLILDEPFNGLDPVGRFEMSSLLKTWAGEGRSLILASHILHEVEAVNPSFLLISGGRLLASGSPAEVRSILANAPYTLTIRTSASKKLASLLVENFDIESIEFTSDDSLLVSTRTASEVFNNLPTLLHEHQIYVDEMSSSDDSLKTLFSTLMKMHRGEMNRGAPA
ncbi:MAG: ABC transporter ATP-binding protein [Mariniblastus sp.]|nr:ABC transporter ATP-binding protein [Mariniblastus sp.]